MKHAIRRLREELATLQDTLNVVGGDPSAAGGLAAANLIERELRVEIGELEHAIVVLEAADRPKQTPIVRRLLGARPPVARFAHA